MSHGWRASRSFLRLPAGHPHRFPRRDFSDDPRVAVGDLVILRPNRDRNASPLLLRPLKPGKRLDTHRGAVQHDDIIGRRVRDVVATLPLRSGRHTTEFRIHEVRLEDYVRWTRRHVTPIYPMDAHLIVGLMDLHPSPPASPDAHDEAPPLEILEAGTGHGALTLYLSRAIHAANPAPPSPGEDDGDANLDAWRASRRAIVHTIDVSAKYSAHANGIVKGFRHGLYHRNVDFHVGDVGDWTRHVLQEHDNQAFLSHAFLDLAEPNQHLTTVADALRVDGTLIVFQPSISQIGQCVTHISEQRLPLEMERVLELGVNGGSGGREWDVRLVRPKAAQQAAEKREPEPAADEDSDETNWNGDEAEADGVGSSEENAEFPSAEDQASVPQSEPAMVCRPRVGQRIAGGGFLGVWRKMRA